jgi:hypothetical protein
VAGKSIQQREIEEAAENDKELSHCAHGYGVNEYLYLLPLQYIINIL